MKTKIKVLSLLMAICIVMGLTSTTAFAAGSPDTWDGTADTSWYNDTDMEFHISTAEELAGLARLVNDDIRFEGKTVCLDADIDISGHEWVSIGYGSNSPVEAFCGIFEGQGHEISGLYSHEDWVHEKQNIKTARSSGLFGGVYNAVIKNLGVIDADIYKSEDDMGTYGMGIIADWLTDSTIQNCWSTGSITGGSYCEREIGGIVGTMMGRASVIGCHSSASITGCYTNSGNNYETATDYFDSLGGIAGSTYNETVQIIDCWYDGEIIVNSVQAAVGGIVGYSEGATVSNCMVATDKLDVDEYGNTCWIGVIYGRDAQNCYWPNDDKYGTAPANEESGNPAGTAVDDFMDPSILNWLQANASPGVTWVEGTEHPVFGWDERNISADYSAVETAKAQIPADLSIYTQETVDALNNALASVVQGKSQMEQAEVDAMATAIEDAIAALEYKKADYSKVDEAIAKANALNKSDYKDFSAVEAAVNGVVRDKNITEQAEVDAMAQAIENAIAALEKKPADTATPAETKPNTGSAASPQTSDNSSLYLWFALFVLAGIGFACTAAYCRKKKRDR